jgi:hypothetical protein
MLMTLSNTYVAYIYHVMMNLSNTDTSDLTEYYVDKEDFNMYEISVFKAV